VWLYLSLAVLLSLISNIKGNRRAIKLVKMAAQTEDACDVEEWEDEVSVGSD